jgi:uncharacterized protein YqjF (DUF2071 family)
VTRPPVPGPTSRDAIAAKPFLTAEWRSLVMLNWEADPAALRPLVPRGTELDEWNGTLYASLVGFMFLDTRVMGIAIPFHRSFEELNLRFYVRRRGPEGWRRGVVFVKEVVPRFAIAAVARVLYNENYVAMRMAHHIRDVGDAGQSIAYTWHDRGPTGSLGATTEGLPSPLAEGSEAEFITEHYWGYAAQRDGGTVEYRVEHPSWRVWTPSSTRLKCDFGAMYGARFVEMLSPEPRSAYVAEGSPIVVRRGVRI